MSDYFGALLRMAGAPAVPAAAATPWSAAAPGDDIVEQEVEVEAGERMATKFEPARAAAAEPGAHEAEAPAVGMPPLRAEVAPQRAAAAAVAAPELRAAAQLSFALPQREERALAHPLVRAALRWVAADPPARAQAPAHSDTPPRPSPQPARELEPTLTRAGPLLQPAIDSRAAPSIQAQAAREIELMPPAAPRRHTASQEAQARPLAPTSRTVDVHIGTIHVAVDAPPPRALPPPAPAPAASPQPPQRAAAEPRSGVSRLRLARL